MSLEIKMKIKLFLKVALLICICMVVVSVDAQEKITWETLSEVTFSEEYSDEFGSYVRIPNFSEKVKALNGREVIIEGYMIPVDVTEGLYVISANTFAACFFCGQAGPETVMELEFKKKTRRYNTDEFITIKGVLQLNARDVYKLNYILVNAVEIK
jgi:hypothetical protein